MCLLYRSLIPRGISSYKHRIARIDQIQWQVIKRGEIEVDEIKKYLCFSNKTCIRSHALKTVLKLIFNINSGGFSLSKVSQMKKRVSSLVERPDDFFNSLCLSVFP